jgi:DNA (cytosine-5)-methyltransferase 1
MDAPGVPPVRGQQSLPGVPLVVGMEGRAMVTHVRPVDRPMRAQTGRHQDALVLPVPTRDPGDDNAIGAASGDGPSARRVVSWPELLIPYYGTGRARPATGPMGTLSTRDRFGLLDPCLATSLDPLDCLFRMLEPAEIAAGMAFGPGYRILGTRRERVRQAGNAVTPPAARDLIAALVELISGQAPTFAPDQQMGAAA